jgi:hypothetical protein
MLLQPRALTRAWFVAAATPFRYQVSEAND